MKITCPHCEKTINAPDKYAGRVVKCPGCGGEMELPSLEELQAMAPPPEPPAPPPQQAAPPPPQRPSKPPPPPAPEEETEDVPAPEPEEEAEPEQEAPVRRPTSRRKKSERGASKRKSDRSASKRKSSRRSRAGADDGGDEDSGGVSDRVKRQGEAALGGYRRNMVIMGLLMLLLAGASAVCAFFAGVAGLLGAVGAAAGEVAMEHGAVITAESGSPVGPESGAPIAALQTLAAAGIASAMVFAGCAALNFILSFCAFFKANFANYLGLVVNLALAGLSGYLITVVGPPLAVVTVPAAIVVLLAFMNIKARGKINAAGLSLSGKRGGGRSRSRRGGRSGDDEDEPKGSRRKRAGGRSRSRRR